MSTRRTRLTIAACFLVLLTARFGLAGIMSGKITAISADDAEITVETKDGKKSQAFHVVAKTAIQVDGKTAVFDNLASGMQISVFTNAANQVTKIVARHAAELPGDAPPARKPAKKPAGKKSRGGSTPPEGDETAPWPQFLGPNRDNQSNETGLLKRWPENGPKLLWTANGLGAGYSSVSVAQGLVFTMGNRPQGESILALRLDNGAGVWEAAIGPTFREGMGDGPRGVPTVEGETLYALGASGDLACAETRTGKIRWRKNILTEFEGNPIKWGICESVLIDGDRLICTPGGKQAAMVALNKVTGKVLWKAVVPGGSDAGYASSVAMEVGGVRQYVQFMQRGTVGIRAEDGKFLWANDSSANPTANCSAPVWQDDMVFTASDYGTGGAMLKLASSGKTTTATLAYRTNKMKNHHGGMVALKGFLYGADDATWTCLDLATGTVKWQNRSVGKGSLTLADGKLILRSESGPVALVEATAEDYREISQFAPGSPSGKQTWPYPVVAAGRLFLRDQDILQCYDLRQE